MKNISKGFTLIEVLIVVLILGVLAAIALPKYQIAVDKARYSKLMSITKSIVDAHIYASLSKDNPSFNDFEIEAPRDCNIVTDHPWAITCDNGDWGCLIRKNGNETKYWIRCTDKKLKASYFYTVFTNGTEIERRCYAHTTENPNDRPNRLCKALTNKTMLENTEGIAMFWQPEGPWVQSNGYTF